MIIDTVFLVPLSLPPPPPHPPPPPLHTQEHRRNISYLIYINIYKYMIISMSHTWYSGTNPCWVQSEIFSLLVHKVQILNFHLLNIIINHTLAGTFIWTLNTCRLTSMHVVHSFGKCEHTLVFGTVWLWMHQVHAFDVKLWLPFLLRHRWGVPGRAVVRVLQCHQLWGCLCSAWTRPGRGGPQRHLCG